MIRLKLFLHAMLALPFVKEVQTHYAIIFCVIAYCMVLFMVLKAFQFNKDKFEK